MAETLSVPPDWKGHMIGISNYEGLCNRRFNLPEHIRQRGQEGYKFVRCFTDLGWGGAAGVVTADKNFYLYEFDPITKSYNPDKINKLFVEKLYESGRAAKQAGMEGIVLCLASNPKYWQKTANVKGYGSYPWELGFRETRGFMQVADPTGEAPEYPEVLVRAWKHFTKYIEDLVQVCLDSPNPFMFRLIETYNELYTWGSIAETHPWIAQHLKKVRPNILFQFNPPLEELEKCVESANTPEKLKGCFRWPHRLMDGYKGFKAHRFSFHGFYKGREILETAQLLKKGNIPVDQCLVETDGATPNTTFSREDHARHYLWRTSWDDNATNTNKTIAAHRDLIAASKASGLSLNIQSPIKWSLMEVTPSLHRFYKECAEEMKK